MQTQIEKRGLHGFEIRPKFTQISGDKIVGSSEWKDAEGRRHERYIVLTIRDAQIADMQVCGTRRQAMRFAKRTLG